MGDVAILRSEAKKGLLLSLYYAGFYYIARDNSEILYAYSKKPEWDGEGWAETGGVCISLEWVDNLLFFVKKSEPLHILTELCGVDWQTVKRDTPVLVYNKESDEKHRRYFCGFNECLQAPFITYSCGRTSWTDENSNGEVWKFCELADDEEEYQCILI